jgi:acyl-CoA oxidase
VIHTPTKTATKVWAGDLGRFSTHAIVFARLIIDETDYGIQPFMVRLRDLSTFKHLPGVKTGDMGPKIGYHCKDNGWASFN